MGPPVSPRIGDVISAARGHHEPDGKTSRLGVRGHVIPPAAPSASREARAREAGGACQPPSERHADGPLEQLLSDVALKTGDGDAECLLGHEAPTRSAREAAFLDGRNEVVQVPEVS